MLCRLLEWDEVADFTCKKCEVKLESGGMLDVICDGIMMGCKKHYLEEDQMAEPEDQTPIEGTKHSDR